MTRDFTITRCGQCSQPGHIATSHCKDCRGLGHKAKDHYVACQIDGGWVYFRDLAEAERARRMGMQFKCDKEDRHRLVRERMLNPIRQSSDIGVPLFSEDKPWIKKKQITA